jgi:hypothetical protein
MIELTGNKSVFRNHDVKNAIYVAFEGSLLLTRWKKEKGNENEPISEGELMGLGIAASAIGPLGTKKRFEWMYVDIIQDEDDGWSVSSPLKNDKQLQVINYTGIKGCIRYLEWLIGILGSNEVVEYRQQRREWLTKNDPDFPKNPKW